MKTYQLPPTLTHPEPGDRLYRFARVAHELVDGYMTISQGRPGPRGGTSHVSVESYYVQVHEPDVGEGESPDTVVMLLKDGPVPQPDLPGGSGLELVDATTPQTLYAVTLCPVRGPWCVCTGFVTQHTCKHCDAVYHLFRVVGWGE